MRGALGHETRQWIEQATGGRIVRRRRLHGGIIARVDELVVARGDQTHAFVLRRYDDDPKAVAYEARILAALEAVDLPTPRLVGTDASALLMTKLPGHLDLCPQDRSAKLRAMAAALPVLHAADVLRPVGIRLRLNPRSYEWVRAVDPWHDVHRLGVYGPEWPQFIPIQVHGRAPVPRGMTARVEQLLRQALARF